MSFLELKNYLKFTYRNSQSLATFDVSSEFIFVVTGGDKRRLFLNGLGSDQLPRDHLGGNTTHSLDPLHGHTPTKILQYSRLSPIPLISSIPFTPVFSCYYKGRFFLASQDELFYFKYTLHSLYRITTLAYTFFFNNYLITVGDKANIYILEEQDEKFSLSLYKEESIVNIYKGGCGNNCPSPSNNCHSPSNNCPSPSNNCNYPTSSSNGLCSAHLILNGKVFLGFENGVVGEFFLESGQISVLLFLKDPVLSICGDQRLLFIHTLSGVFRYVLDTESRTTSETKSDIETKTFTEIRGRKMLKYGDILVLQQEKRLVLMNSDLKIIKTFLSLFDIREVKIGECLTVGCVNGIINEYSLDLFKFIEGN